MNTQNTRRTKRSLFIVAAVTAATLCIGLYFVLSGPEPDSGGETREFDAHVPGSVFGDFSPDGEEGTARYEPEAYSPEQRALTERLHADLPGNLFLPPLFSDDDEARLADRDERLRKMRSIYFRIEDGSATPGERSEYYTFRIRYNEDRIAILEYLTTRSETGTRVRETPPAHVREMIAATRRESEEFRRKL